MTLRRKAEHSTGTTEVGKRSLPRYLMGRSKGILVVRGHDKSVRDQGLVRQEIGDPL